MVNYTDAKLQVNQETSMQMIMHMVMAVSIVRYDIPTTFEEPTVNATASEITYSPAATT
jgi:hypothetical protein